MKTMPAPQEPTDLELCALARGGDRDAFGRMVARHQTLVVSLAYSICGDFARSQDIAQEAFLSAWRQLGSLDDEGKFKAWLCGITRNLGYSSLRQQTRRAEQPAADEAAPENATGAPDPHEQAVTSEEAAIVWKALEKLPEVYREPLVLFYREHHSVERVAEALDLSEDTVKQRLSRGRGMLREQVEKLVERSLGCTTPGAMFTTAVLGALPVAATQIAAAAVAGAAAKGGAAAKSAGGFAWLATVVSPLLAIPFISFLGTAIHSRLVGRFSRSEEEGKLMQRMIWITGGAGTLVMAAMLGLGWWQSRQYENHAQPMSPATDALISLGLMAVVVVVPVVVFVRNRRSFLMYARDARPPENAPRWIQKLRVGVGRALIHRSRLTLLGLPLVDIRFRHSVEQPLVRGTAVGWIALGDVAHGVVFALGGIAVGGIAVGGIAIGALSTGWLAVGLVAAGGVAVGGLAKGVVLAVGYIALGSVAVGWEGASGIVSAARHLASGAIAFGGHTSRGIGQTWEQTNPIVQAFKPTWLLETWLFAVINAVIAMVGVGALARHGREQAVDGTERFVFVRRFLLLLPVAVIGCALVFHAVIERESRRLAAESESVSLARARYELGRELARSGKPAEALVEFLWRLEDLMKRGRDLNDTGAVYARIEELSRNYAPARAALVARRDRAEAAVRTGRMGNDGIIDVWEVVCLNLFLEETGRSVALRDQLPASHPLRPLLDKDLSPQPVRVKRPSRETVP